MVDGSVRPLQIDFGLDGGCSEPTEVFGACDRKSSAIWRGKFCAPDRWIITSADDGAEANSRQIDSRYSMRERAGADDNWRKPVGVAKPGA